MIKNLLFDLGGVIMDIRRNNCIAAFRELGMAHPEEYLGEYVQSGPFEGIENGSVTPARFRDEIRRAIGNPALTDSQIDTAFERFLIGIPAVRLEQLRELHRHYRLYLLSNTNPIMWNDKISADFRQEGHNVDYYFDGIVKSYEARVMKPSAEIFRYTEQKLGIVPAETLFLDDSQKNLDAASQLGYHTLLVPPGSDFFELLKQYPGIEV